MTDVKKKLRFLMRRAISQANRIHSVGCHECIFNEDGICDKGLVVRTTHHRVPLPYICSGFTLDIEQTGYDAVYRLLIAEGFEVPATKGWGSYVNRVLARTNKAGHLMNLRPGQLL